MMTPYDKFFNDALRTVFTQYPTLSKDGANKYTFQDYLDGIAKKNPDSKLWSHSLIVEMMRQALVKDPSGYNWGTEYDSPAELSDFVDYHKKKAADEDASIRASKEVNASLKKHIDDSMLTGRIAQALLIVNGEFPTLANTPANTKLLKDFIDPRTQDFDKYTVEQLAQVFRAAVAVNKPNLFWNRPAKEKPVETNTENLQEGQLSIHASSYEMNHASPDQLRDLLRRQHPSAAEPGLAAWQLKLDCSLAEQQAASPQQLRDYISRKELANRTASTK